MKTIFQGRFGAPRISLAEPAHDLDHMRRLAESVAKNLGPAYYWCGIFSDDDELMQEFRFSNEFSIR